MGMTPRLLTLASLILAAALESGGDALIRRGLLSGARAWLVVGALVLTLYGFVVNLNRAVDFGPLMGAYIAVFFVVSQVVAVAVLGERPAPMTVLGGAFIVAGGLLVQYGARLGP
jgi:drug/metabolite transporter superfamily protein YnfA